MKDKYYWMWREEKKRVKELENSLSIALENVSRYQQDLKIKDDEIGRLYHKIKN
jgi:hypothetical protein